jgi:hypothetical protein
MLKPEETLIEIKNERQLKAVSYVTRIPIKTHRDYVKNLVLKSEKN